MRDEREREKERERERDRENKKLLILQRECVFVCVSVRESERGCRTFKWTKLELQLREIE